MTRGRMGRIDWGIITALTLFAVILACVEMRAQGPAPPAPPTKVAGPLPIPEDRHEGISKLMLSFQAAQLDARRAQDDLDRAMKNYQALIEVLRKEFNAPGRELTMEKKWSCPPPASK